MSCDRRHEAYRAMHPMLKQGLSDRDTVSWFDEQSRLEADIVPDHDAHARHGPSIRYNLSRLSSKRDIEPFHNVCNGHRGSADQRWGVATLRYHGIPRCARAVAFGIVVV